MTITVVKGQISQSFKEGIEFFLDDKDKIIGAKTIIEPMIKGYNSDTKENVKEGFPLEVEIRSSSIAQSLFDYVSNPKNMTKFKHCKPIVIGELFFDYIFENKKVGTKIEKVRKYLPPKIVVTSQEGFVISGDLCFSLGFVRTAKDFQLKYSESGSVTAYNTAVYNTYDAARKDETSEDRNIKKGLLDNWIDFKLFGKKAESIAEYIKKGQQVFLIGMLNLGIFTPKDKDGTPKGDQVKKLSWNVFDFQFAENRSGSGERKADLGIDELEEEEEISESDLIGEDEIPF